MNTPTSAAHIPDSPDGRTARLLAERDQLNRALLTAASDTLADQLRGTLHAVGLPSSPLRIHLSEEDGGGAWPSAHIDLGADTGEQVGISGVANDLVNVNPWPSFQTWADALADVHGRDATFGMTVDLTDAGGRNPNVEAQLAVVADVANLELDPIVGFSWLTTSSAEPVHLEVTFRTPAGTLDGDYLYRDEFTADQWAEIERLVDVAFADDPPHGHPDRDRSEWNWARPAADTPSDMPGDVPGDDQDGDEPSSSSDVTDEPTSQDVAVCDECGASWPDGYPSHVGPFHQRACSLHGPEEPGGTFADLEADGAVNERYVDWDDATRTFRPGSGRTLGWVPDWPGDRPLPAPMRKSAISAVALLTGLGRAAAATRIDELMDTRGPVVRRGDDAVGATVDAYHGDPTAVAAAVVALLATFEGVDMTADVSADDATVTLRHGDTELTAYSGSWSQAHITDGGALAGPVLTGLTDDCHDPLRIARRLVRLTGR